MADLDNLKDKYEGKRENKLADTVKGMKSLTKQLEGKKDSAPVRAAKQAVSGFRSQWSGMDDEGKVGIGKGVPGIYYDTVAIPALAGIVDDKYAPEFAVEADKKAGKIREAIRKDMGIEAPKGALEHFANAGGTMLGQLPIPGAWLKRVLTPVKEAGIAGKVATSPIEYLSPIVEPKAINYGVGTGFGGTIGVVGEALEGEDPVKKALGGLIQKYETGGKVGKVKSFFSAVDKAIDTLKQKKGTGEQILKEIEKAPGVKKEELELRNIREKLKDKKSITQDEVRALAAESPAPSIKPIVLGGGAPLDWKPKLTDKQKELLDIAGIEPVVNPEDPRMLGFLIRETGDIIDQATLKTMTPADFGIDDTRVKELAAAREAGTITPEQLEEIRRLQRDDVLLNTKILASEIQNQFLMDQRPAKFEKYTTPGGENYREVLLQLDKPVGKPRDSLGGAPREVSREEAADYLGLHPDMIGEESQILIYPNGAYIERLPDGEYYGMAYNEEKVSANIEDIEEFLASRIDSDMMAPGAPDFRSGHFDEPNILVHARVTDRTGPNGEKVLYVEEIQSDWHQQARKERDRVIASEMSRMMPEIRGQAEEMATAQGIDITTDSGKRQLTKIREDLTEKAKETIGKTIPKDVAYAKPMKMFEGMSADDLLWDQGDNMTSEQRGWLKDYIERWELDVDGTPAGQAAQDQLVKEYDEWISKNTLKGVPNAPFKTTSHEIAMKQILDMAAKEGYDKVAIAPGAEQIKRYNMSQHIDLLTGQKGEDGLISLTGIRDDRPIVTKTGLKPDELADYVGKEKADRILSDLERSNEFALRGRDLEMTTKEGAGKKKIYDEILPNYLGKYVKKEFGVEPGQVDIEFGGPKTEGDRIIEEERIRRIMDEIGDEDNDELMARTMDINHTMAERALEESGIMRDATDPDQFEDQMWNVMDEFAERAREQAARQMAIERIKEQEPGRLSAFSVDVTPQMREKITGEGQKLFAAAPVVGVQAIPGMEEVPQQAAPEPESEVEEAPMPFQSGGQAMGTPRSELEEDPFVQTVLNAARHYQGGKEIEAGQMGFSKGPVTVGMNAANIIDPGTRDKMQAQALFAAYRDRLGNVDVNASVNRPNQAPDGFYQGNIMASTPVGQGRAMAGVSGYKSPQKTDVSGYNFGYEQKVGPGYASGMVFQPKDRRQDTRYDVQYTIPFQSGGPVGLQAGGRVGKTREAAEKLLRVLHGSPTRITPEQGKAIDVTTEPSYAVKRGTDKMMGKSGPPMVNQFDVPAGKILQFEEQYSPEDVALMRRYFNKLPQGQAMRGEEIFDAAQGRDAILEGIAKAGGFAGYERPNTGAVGKGQWFRITEPEELVRKARGGLAQFSKPL
jgi:uncharacterized protein YidB (DUF937 family)